MEIAVVQENLFALPIWIYDLSFLSDIQDQMIGSALDLVSNEPANEFAKFQQSRPILQELGLPEWDDFFLVFGEICTTIVKETFQTHARITRGTSESWVVRIDGSTEYDDYGGELSLLHSHRGSLLSSVFYLSVPKELRGDPLGGTLFRDPHAAAAHEMRPTYHRVLAEPLSLLVFPSFIEHAPSEPQGSVAYSSPRVIVSTDFA